MNPARSLQKTIGAALAALFVGATAADAPPASEFGEFSGCALLLTRDRHREQRVEYGPEQCALPQPPCSTFKIPNALIGLQTGVVSGPDHLMPWDGTVHEFAERNRDHTLASAIRYSVVWYFQELAREVGEARMQQWLDALDYGNRDISGGIDQFWLGSSLLITPREQLELLKRLRHGTLPFQPEFQAQLRDMLVLDSELAGTLHGKTGSCRGQPDTGWFIGWVDWNDASGRNPATTWFVVNIRGASAWGRDARGIALRLLAQQQP